MLLNICGFKENSHQGICSIGIFAECPDGALKGFLNLFLSSSSTWYKPLGIKPANTS